MEYIKNFFKFLEDKEGKRAPLNYKLLYDPESITPEDLNIKGSLNLMDTKITSLPNNLRVGGNLDLVNTPITSLPDNLKVEGSLYLWNTKITSLPNNLKVGRDLYIYYTPLNKKYTKEEIEKMVKDKGGNIGGGIYL